MPNTEHTTKKAAILMMTSALMFAMMQIVIGLTADTIPVFEQVFFRNLIAAGVALFYIKKDKVKFSGEKKHIKFLLLRSLAGFIGMLSLFYAAGNGDQGDISTIMNTSPFFTMLFACVFLKDKLYRYQIVAMIIAFIGALFVAGPGLDSALLPLLAALGGAVFSGVAYTLISFLKGKEHPWLIIFVFSLVSTLGTVPLMALDFVLPTLEDFILLLLIGLFAAGGQLALTYSYTLAPATKVSIYNYSGIVFSMILAYFILGQVLGANSYIGGGLVITGGIIMFIYGKKVSSEEQRAKEAEEVLSTDLNL